MMCYKDMTFCDFQDCEHEKCHRRLTNEHSERANERKIPISMFAEKPDCYKSNKRHIDDKSANN